MKKGTMDLTAKPTNRPCFYQSSRVMNCFRSIQYPIVNFHLIQNIGEWWCSYSVAATHFILFKRNFRIVTWFFNPPRCIFIKTCASLNDTCYSKCNFCFKYFFLLWKTKNKIEKFKNPIISRTKYRRLLFDVF